MKSLSPTGSDLSSRQSVLESRESISETNVWIASPEETENSPEYCQNPWNPDCESPDIELYIVYKSRKIPLCRSCWRIIAETELEW